MENSRKQKALFRFAYSKIFFLIRAYCCFNVFHQSIMMLGFFMAFLSVWEKWQKKKGLQMKSLSAWCLVNQRMLLNVCLVEKLPLFR